jgi:uncharacterized LabA/DUF88 family protein/cold shock CspA family protein
MTNSKDSRLIRIGVFYDGYYFLNVSNFYYYAHERKSRLSIAGLHNFIKNQVAKHENTDERFCQIIDAHYFKGRLSAFEASSGVLYYDRVSDDILSSEGVTTHYLPLKLSKTGAWQEKGIDVWLALEAFELAYYKRFDVLVLIASDGDYVPLIRKLNTLGTRVMLLSWDFEYINNVGLKKTQKTSQDLLEEATYPVAMHELIDNRVSKNEPIINGLFVPKKSAKTFSKAHIDLPTEQKSTLSINTIKNPATATGKKISKISMLKGGFGFIENKPKNIFFFHSDLMEYDFNDLVVGDKVEFGEETKEDGQIVAKEIRVIE